MQRKGVPAQATACWRNAASASLLLATLALLPQRQADAFAAGSPICEVQTLPLVEMSPTLADPPPFGWSLQIPVSAYVPGRPLPLRIRHPDPGKRVRGVLLFAKSGPFSGAGSFSLPPQGYQYIPAPAQCGQWAISHSDSDPKEQAELLFEWTGQAQGTVILRAFLIEDCALPSGGCRDQQALTEVVVLLEALFVDGFESEP